MSRVQRSEGGAHSVEESKKKAENVAWFMWSCLSQVHSRNGAACRWHIWDARVDLPIGAGHLWDAAAVETGLLIEFIII